MIFWLPTSNHSLLIRKSKRAKRYLLKINRCGNAELVIPFYHSYKEAKFFIKGNEEKITLILKKLKKNCPVKNLINYKSHYITPYSSIHITNGSEEATKVLKNGDQWIISLQQGNSIHSEETQFVLKQHINQILKKEATTYLPKRLSCLSSLHQLSFTGLTIRNNKTVWGSCTRTNKINLNLQLMRLPSHLIDYIILHELAHIKEKNHGSGFWHFLSQLDPEAKIHAKELRQYSPCL